MVLLKLCYNRNGIQFALQRLNFRIDGLGHLLVLEGLLEGYRFLLLLLNRADQALHMGIHCNLLFRFPVRIHLG
ncbi:hypothetical protein D3C76_1727100 [compost metagenome]